MTYVVPTILVPTSAAFDYRLSSLRPHFLRAQLDVLNGTFAPAQTFCDAGYIDQHHDRLMFEIDLMVDLDGYDLEVWNRPWVDKIIFHIEACRDPKPIIKKITGWGKKVFLSLNPETDLEAVRPYLKSVNGILFLAVNPGQSGSTLQPQVLDKIKSLRQQNAVIDIEVDGGVNDENLPALLDVGANGFAVGSFLDNREIEERLLRLITIIENFERRSPRI